MWRETRVRAILAVLVAVPLLLVGAFVIAVLVTPLPAPSTAEATEVLDAAGRPITRLYTQNRRILPAGEMPQYLLDAIVAVEDDRFYAHRGIDLIGIGRALVRDLRAGKVVEGGSTLTQQLARNMYLTQERTVARKLREAVLTVKLEAAYSKQEILVMYWNTIYLGEGTYGAEVAAETYFGKSARNVTLAEAALLAGLPRSPEYYSPLKNLDAAAQRRNLVLQKMAGQGFITAPQATAAAAEPVRLASAGTRAADAAPYFIDYVTKELQQRFPRVARDLYQGGYVVHTTLDPDLQAAADTAVGAAAPPADARLQPQAALVAVESATGYIRAMVGGRQPRVDRNRALEAHQPGSAFKPFVYATLLSSRSFTAASTQPDAPVEFPGVSAGAAWRPRNHGDQYSNQPAGMREALRKSLNVVTARWMDVVKPGPVISLAKRMGIESPIPSNLTIGLGSAAVTPLELTRAYAPFANGGYAVRPLAVLRVTDRDGNRVAEQSPSRTRVLDPGVAFIVTDMLKDVLKPGGTAGQVAGYLGGRPAAGKTGTSDQSVDAWFVGYTPELVTGVWVGTDERSPSYREGGTSAAPIFGQFVSNGLRRVPFRDWSPPANVLAAEICAPSGLLPNASCPLASEWFLAGTAPTKVDPTVYADHLLPGMPGMPWAPPGSLPPGMSPGLPPG
ncbi:MAG TPA: PBP1A family penicillin-binding protein [Symbiobacteriaceae bacterium]|jgi:1A family penicillin-binding protein